MRRIDPFSLPNPGLLPCNVYPFICGTGEDSYAIARASLKLCSLLHESIHLPGSVALQDPFVQALMIELAPFLENGQLRLDLRSSCASFSDLVSVKYSGSAPDEISRMAAFLDTKCKAALSFDAANTATGYSEDMIKVAREALQRARSQEVIAALNRAISFLHDRGPNLSIDTASSLMMGTRLHSRFRAVAKLFYSIHGAKVTNSDPIIPLQLWQTSFPLIRHTHFPDEFGPKLPLGTDLELANDVVMDYFSIEASHIDKLNAHQIIELKSEPMTERYIRELNDAIRQATLAIQREEGITDITRLARDRANLIRRSVQAKCKNEEKRIHRESWIFGTASEIGGLASDYVAGTGFIRSGLTTLARRLARKHKTLAWLDYTSAPLITHVSRLRGYIFNSRGGTRPRPNRIPPP